MATITNPAARLHAVLAEASGMRHATPAVEVWSQVLRVPYAPPGPFLRRIVDVTSLAEKVKVLITDLPAGEDPEMLLADFSQVEALFENFLRISNLNMVDFMAPLAQTGLQSLAYARGALNRAGISEDVLPAETLDDLRDEVHDLIGEVRGADGLSAEEQRSIVSHLRAVEDVLGNAMQGSDDLREEAEGLGGAVMALPNRAFANPVVRAVALFAGQVITAVAINIATDYTQNELEQGPQQAPVSVVILERIGNGQALPALAPPPAQSDNDQAVLDAEVVDEGR